MINKILLTISLFFITTTFSAEPSQIHNIGDCDIELVQSVGPRSAVSIIKPNEPKKINPFTISALLRKFILGQNGQPGFYITFKLNKQTQNVYFNAATKTFETDAMDVDE